MSEAPEKIFLARHAACDIPQGFRFSFSSTNNFADGEVFEYIRKDIYDELNKECNMHAKQATELRELNEKLYYANRVLLQHNEALTKAVFI